MYNLYLCKNDIVDVTGHTPAVSIASMYTSVTVPATEAIH